MLLNTRRFFVRRHISITMLALLAMVFAATVSANDSADQSEYIKISKKKLPKVHGRLGLDAAGYKKDITKMGSGTEISYARFSLRGDIDPGWSYKLEYDFAGNGSIKNVWLGYRPKGMDYRIKIGNMIEPISMDEMTSSADISFLERALPNVFVPSYHLGVTVDGWHSSFYYSAGIYGDTPSANPSNEGNESYGVSGRMTYAPIETDKAVLHFGMSVAASVPDSTKQGRFRARPESDLTDVRFVDTGKINDVSHQAVGGLETAAMFGPLALQGEYLKTHVARNSGADPLEFKGRYAQLSWLLGDAERSYKRNGTFGNIKPTGDGGVWELALRYSYLDLNNKDISGGEERNITYGINYYFNPELRLMTNYIKVDARKNGVTELPEIFTVRMQANF
jgi:phosphate-selective porin OprO/OprP